MLEVIPMFDGLPILKSKNFKANFYDIEVVICVGKNVVTILKNTYEPAGPDYLRQYLPDDVGAILTRSSGSLLRNPEQFCCPFRAA